MQVSMQRSVVRAVLAGAATVGLVLGVSLPAHAVSDLAIVKVGSATSVTGYTVFTMVDQSTAALYVTANWTAHTTSSAKLTTFNVCAGTLGNSGSFVMLRVVTNVNGKIVKDYGVAHKLYSRTCNTFTANKVFTATSGHELVRVWAYLVDVGGGLSMQTVSFTR
ncbi:MAG: hypothetical protein ABI632_11110 [Pseudolysinimonas sp.]